MHGAECIREGLVADPLESLRAVTFLRQIALLLPSAFLVGVLLFLLTHGRGDPGFGTIVRVNASAVSTMPHEL